MRCTLIKEIIGMYFHICNWFQLIEPNSSKSKEFCLNYILKSKFYTSAYDTVYINMYYFTHTCTTQVSKTMTHQKTFKSILYFKIHMYIS